MSQPAAVSNEGLSLSNWALGTSSRPMIHSLISEVVDLLGCAVIQDHTEAREVLEQCVDCVYCRNGLEPLECQEQATALGASWHIFSEDIGKMLAKIAFSMR